MLYVNSAVLIVGLGYNLYYCVLEKAQSDRPSDFNRFGSVVSSHRESIIVERLLQVNRTSLKMG